MIFVELRQRGKILTKRTFEIKPNKKKIDVLLALYSLLDESEKCALSGLLRSE
jgi:hypothetical protein